MNMRVRARGAAKILLGVNVVLLCGFAFIPTAILLENSDLYTCFYNVTYAIQPLIAYSWFLALVLSPTLAIAFSLLFGTELRKTIHWKMSIALMVLVGLPSLAFAVVGYFMRGI